MKPLLDPETRLRAAIDRLLEARRAALVTERRWTEMGRRGRDLRIREARELSEAVKGFQRAIAAYGRPYHYRGKTWTPEGQEGAASSTVP